MLWNGKNDAYHIFNERVSELFHAKSLYSETIHYHLRRSCFLEAMVIVNIFWVPAIGQGTGLRTWLLSTNDPHYTPLRWICFFSAFYTWGNQDGRVIPAQRELWLIPLPCGHAWACGEHSWGEAGLHSGKRTWILILASFGLLTCVGRTSGRLLNCQSFSTVKWGRIVWRI